MRHTLTIAILTMLSACATPPEARVEMAPDPPTETPESAPVPPTTSTHEGAWYGSGEAFPDGQLCIILCDNGRLFLGDKLCTQADAGDFRAYFKYTREGDRILTSFKKVGDFGMAIDGDKAQLSFLKPRLQQFSGLPLERVAESSPLCSDPAISEGDPDTQ